MLGHVDHGKSSLLEAIKEDFKITTRESGGITQHIGAYEIEKSGKKITFIDTPGHEAFSAMRGRGAKVADIAILVVAADEGVKPQTKEAILHIRKAEIPSIVVFNKIDKPNVDIEKIKRELEKEGVLVESFGGKIPGIEVSAKTGQGIPELLETILLLAEVEDLKTDIEGPTHGIIIESYLDNFRGPIATLILEQGILKPGQIIGTFSVIGKIKILENFQGIPISQVLPGQPAVVLGFEMPPKIGEEFKVFDNIESAKNEIKILEKKDTSVIFNEEGKKILNLILKADFLGSLEAIEKILKELPQEKIVLRILKSEVGEVTEADVKLASQSKAKILGFRVKTNFSALKLAEREKIKIMNFEIIYTLVEGMRNYMEKLMAPETSRIDLGKMKVLVVFHNEKNRQVVGGKIIEGEIKKGCLVEIFRQEEKIGQGKIINLQRNKKDVDIVMKGDECGILCEGDGKIEQGDILAFYFTERRKGEL